MPRLRKNGFTLIELLIVTVVIATLMAVVFRLTGIVGSANNRETTVYRMQCLENCLSGYYATFGQYPPVPLQGASRNIYRETSDTHTDVQSGDPDDTDDSELNYKYVNAACKAQPVAALYPPPSELTTYDPETGAKTTITSDKAYENFQKSLQSALDSGFYDDDDTREHVETLVGQTWRDVSSKPGFLNPYQGETDSTQLQLFRFGLMSFLLPRYKFMLDCAKGSQSGNTEAFNNSIDKYKQWTEYNTLPVHMDSGIPYNTWKDFCDIFGSEDEWQVDLIPSQAACARWMPNLRNIVSGRHLTMFGVYLGNSGSSQNGLPSVKYPNSFSLYFPGGKNSSSSSGYPLQSTSVRDGWGRDFYYYSPAPYQTYVLWSAGANGKTFPPWVDLEQFQKDHSDQYETAVKWMADDIKFMSTGN